MIPTKGTSGLVILNKAGHAKRSYRDEKEEGRREKGAQNKEQRIMKFERKEKGER
jgi:hypothetical protein